MGLKFCPKCGTLMTPKIKESITYFVCRKCGYEERVKEGSFRVRREIKNKKRIVVIEEDISMKIYPKVKITCPKCGHNEAYFWTLQTRAADEPATRFFKCVKCGHVWREYD